MDPLNALRLTLVTCALVGIVYACSGSGAFSKGDWWKNLPQTKKLAFGVAIAATVLQSFL